MKIAVLHWSTSSVGGINTSLQTLRKVANDKGDTFHVFACDDQKTKKPCNIESKLVRGGGTYNDKEFDYTDPETFAWDILGPNSQKIEVKRKNRNFKCLNLNFKNEDYEGKYSFYDTFFKYCDRLDYLVVADIVDEKVQIEYIIFAKHFRNYIQSSNKIAGGSSHFFKDYPAENNGDLIRF